ncbi:MAG TPA: hypothetical protein VGW34_04170 [Allosphingosinicella sp.]|nr:hypothetical protein [Allosphingosinicella sp.]
MDNGQTYGDTRIAVSGRVSAVAVNPANRNNILCGSAAGGVWQSLDGGTSWTPRTDLAPTLTTGAIAFARSAPGTVYVGTGEGNFYASLGQGVLRSTDGGATFTRIASAPLVGTGFYDLVVDPANAQRLFAATTNGLWGSTDGGVSWTRHRAGKAWEISIAGGGGAGAEILAACADGLFRSTDGTAWTPVALPGGAPFTRLAVDHARSDPSVAYAFGSAGGQRRLWRRAAGQWQTFTVPADRTTEQDWYNWFLGAAPDRSDRVYIGGVEAWRGDLSGASWSWTRISNKAGQDIHPDQHAIAFDPMDPNVILIGNDGGLYRSPDCGQTWQSLNNGLAVAEIEYIAQDPGSAHWLIGGTQDNGSIRYRGSPVWDHIADGDGGDCGVDRLNPNTVFHTYFGMGMERSTTRGDFGSFSFIGPSVPAGYDALFYPPMEVNGATVAQAGQSVFVSRNSGSGWAEVALPGGLATALHVPTADLVFVGTKAGRLFRIRWLGSAWSSAQPLANPRPGAWISDINASADGNRLWATSSTINGGRVFLSMDAGSTWTNRTAGLPNLPVNAVEVDPANANRLWVAADIGVYQSLDAGLSWSVFGAGLPNVLVADLLLHPSARLLRVGTRNRGVWEIPVDGASTEQSLFGVQFSASIPANSTRRWSSPNWPASWQVFWSVMPITVAPGAAQLQCKVQVERSSASHVTYWIEVKNLIGRSVDFEGRYAILSRS